MFYEELKKEILDLISKNELQKALKLIENELSMPYIPTDIEKFLLETSKEIQGILNKEIQKNSLSLETIKKQLLSEDSTLQAIAINNLEKINIRELLESVAIYFKKEKNANDLKSLILVVLYNQKVDKDFEFVRNGKIKIVNTQKTDIPNLFKIFNTINELIEKIIGELDRTVSINASKLALLFLLNRFPEPLDFTIESLTAMVIKKSYNMLGIEKEWSEIQKIIIFNEDEAIRLEKEDCQ